MPQGAEHSPAPPFNVGVLRRNSRKIRDHFRGDSLCADIARQSRNGTAPRNRALNIAWGGGGAINYATDCSAIAKLRLLLCPPWWFTSFVVSA